MTSQLSKILKILFALEFILILIISLLFLIENQKITGYVVKENDIENVNGVVDNDFKLLTKAVCEEKSGHLFCNDKLFVRCKNEEYVIEKNANNFNCSNIIINFSEIKVTGHGVFRNDWADPRG